MKISACLPFCLLNLLAPSVTPRIEPSRMTPQPRLPHHPGGLSSTSYHRLDLGMIEIKTEYLPEQPGDHLLPKLMGFFIKLGPLLDGLTTLEQTPHIGRISQFFPAMLERYIKFPIDYVVAHYWGARMLCERPEQMPPHPRTLVADTAHLPKPNCYFTLGNDANQSETLVIDITGGGAVTASQHNSRMLGAIAQDYPNASYWVPILELIDPFALAADQVTDRQSLQILSRLENHFRQSPNTKTLILSCNSFGCHVLDRMLHLATWLKIYHPEVKLKIFGRSASVGRFVEASSELDDQDDVQIDKDGPKLLYKAVRPESEHPPIQADLLARHRSNAQPAIDELVVTLADKETLQPTILDWVDWLAREGWVKPENARILFDRGIRYHDPAGTDPFRENQVKPLKSMIAAS